MSIKQAIEALEALLGDPGPDYIKSSAWDKATTALAALRSMPAEPYAYAVYFPDQPTEELVHDLDELLDDMTNREHTITELFATTPTAPKVVSSNLPVVSTAVLSDAERYRWLRDRVTVSHQQRATATGVEYPTTFTLKTSVGSSENIDDAIDAALAGESKP